MKTNLLVNGESLGGSQEGLLAVELYLTERYLFRRNVLNGKVEFAEKTAENQEAKWKALTQTAINSIVIRAKREQICEKGSPKTDITEYLNSDEVENFNPIGFRWTPFMATNVFPL